jgi:hypothetical protein
MYKMYKYIGIYIEKLVVLMVFVHRFHIHIALGKKSIVGFHFALFSASVIKTINRARAYFIGKQY